MQGRGDPATKEGKFQDSYTRNNSLDFEGNLQLIQEYFKTHDPALLDELKAQLKRTPQRAKTEADQDASLDKNQIATFLTDATGRDGKADIKGLPGAVGSHLVPAGTLAKLGKGGRAGRNVARGVRAAGSIGSNVAQTLIENPDADFEDHKKAAVEDFIASTGMRAAGGAGHAIVGGTARVPSPGSGGQAPQAGPSIPGTATPGTGPGGQAFITAGADSPGVASPSPSSSSVPGAPGPPVGMQGRVPPGQPAPTPATPSGQPSRPTAGSDQPPQTATPGQQPGVPLPPMGTQGQPPAGQPAPAHNSPPPQAASPAQPSIHPLPSQAARDQSYKVIPKLRDKAENGGLSLDEERELDRHERTLAATRKHHMETKQQVLRALNPPRELNPHEAQVLAEADRRLAMPEPGAPPATDPAQPPQAAAGADPGAGQPPTPPPQSSAASDIPGTATKPGDPPTSPAKPVTLSAHNPADAPVKPFRPQLDPAGSSRRIHHILNMPPEQRGHANTQADLAVAAKVATDRVKELQNQPGPLSEEQKQELAACQAALARLQQETSPPPQAADGVPPPPGDNTLPAQPAEPTANGGSPDLAISPVEGDANTSQVAANGPPAQTEPVPSATAPPAAANPNALAAPVDGPMPTPLDRPAGGDPLTSSTGVPPPNGKTPDSHPSQSAPEPPVPQKAVPLPPIPFPEHSPEAKAEREKRAPARKLILEQHGVSPEDRARVKATEQGKRPDPKTYMSEAFVQSHREEFVDGASKIARKAGLDRHGPGQRDGTSFVFPSKYLSSVLQEANGSRAKLEKLLGLDPGELGTGPLERVDVKDPARFNIRVPSGNESGANPNWIPGARLPTGQLEGVVDLRDAVENKDWTRHPINL